MDIQTQQIQRLSQTNRLLKLGYLVIGVFGLVGYALAGPEVKEPGSTDPNGNGVVVDRDQVGDAQQIVAVDHEDGFVVMIDEEGKVNVIRRDGSVIVAARKQYADQVRD